MLEDKIKYFLENFDVFSAMEILRLCRYKNLNNLGSHIGEFMKDYFPKNKEIIEEYGIHTYYKGELEKTYFIFKKLLEFKNLSEEISKNALFNQHFSINSVENRYNYYNPEKMRKILERKPNEFPLITLTMTSCKRFDLFKQTVNSFVNCCKDIDKIDKWFCVDDNSSESDRKLMKTHYPFIEFYDKTFEEKGHPQSMNIIRNHVKTPYIFHLEDDWKFYNERNYITDCLEVLNQNGKIQQCLINKNYTEIPSDINILGGQFNVTKNGLRYYIHEYVNTEESRKKWIEKHGSGPSSNYWPHFSFRPSLFRKKVFDELGEFNEKISHFEMEYSERYVKKGYLSAFLEGIYCKHIGRLTSEKDDKSKINAYVLNDEAQFAGKEEKLNKEEKKEESNISPLKAFIVNLERREDRWESMKKQLSNIKTLDFQRFNAVDGKKLKPTDQLQIIFDGNDYNMRKGMVGCAMSHIKLCIQLLKDDTTDVYCLLEDDIDLVPDFDQKLSKAYRDLQNTDWDMCYLGHHLKKEFIDDEVHSKEKYPKVEQWTKEFSLTRSLGGTGGYLINKKGAEKLLNFINITGMTNGIDTVQQKSADILNVYYTYPHLYYSECFRGDNNPDTDIQYDYDSLTLDIEKRLENEVKYYDGKLEEIKDFSLVCDLCVDSDRQLPFFYKLENNLQLIQILEKNIYPYYTLNNKVIIIDPSDNSGRYFNRFQKNGDWNIDDALTEV